MQHKSTDELQEFRWRLGHAAERRGLAQVDIARQMKLKPARVGNWFQGENKPKPAERPILAALLAVDQDWLFKGTGERTEINSNQQMEATPTEIDQATNVGHYLVAEEQGSYGVDAAKAEKELRRNFDRLLAAAEGEVQRLGWIAEQFRQHLSVPGHWRVNPGYETLGAKERALVKAREKLIEKPKAGAAHRSAS